MNIHSSNNDTLIEVRDLCFSRGKNLIFSGVNLEIRSGQITAIMGPSGTGKTTLLKLIGAQLKPDSGQILINGQNVHQLSHKALYSLRQRMGMLFQSGALLTDLSVFDNVAFPLREHTVLPESIIRHLVLSKLQAVGLRGARNLMPAQLSGGMSRRVALARAIALDPMMIMYDEPFTGQDPISKGILVKLIKTVNRALGLTSIVVSHDVTETVSIADYVYLIADGKVVDHGSPEYLYEHEAGSGWAQQFLEALPDGPVRFHYPAGDYLEDLFGLVDGSLE